MELNRKKKKKKCVVRNVLSRGFICMQVGILRGVPFLQHQPSYSNAAHVTGEDNIKKGISRNGSGRQ